MGWIVEIAARRRAANPPNQDAAELIDAADRRGRIVDRWRNRSQRDIDDLDNAEFDILLHRAGRTNVDCGEKLERALLGDAIATRNLY